MRPFASILVFALLALVAGCRPPAAPTPAATPAATAVAPASAKPSIEPVASTAAIPDSALPKVRFLAGAATVVLPVEVPPESEYQIGLSGRKTLGERGMLFYFPQVADIPFWMLDTHIDLDIAFVSRDLKVLAVQTMKADTRDYHTPGTPYLASIEAPAGWYAAHGIKPGATVVFDFDLKAVTGR